MCSTPLQWAVVGLGGSGKGHAANIGRVPALALAGGYDPLPAAREEFAARFGLTAAERLEDLLGRPEIAGLTVATSSLAHTDMALQAIASGKHVLVEKPFGMTAGEVARVLAAAAQAGVVAAPFHNRRYDPDFLLVREVLDACAMGRIRRIHSYVGGPYPNTGWRAVKAQAGGRLYDWGPHLLDQVLSLVPGVPEAVWGTLHAHPERGDADDYFRADLRFAVGPDVTVEMSGFSFLPPVRWEVLGEQGTLRVTGNIHGDFQVAVQVGDDPAQVIETSAAAEREKRGDGSLRLYEELARHLSDGTPLGVTGQDALRVARVMDAIRASAEAGRSQPVGEGAEQ